LLRLVEVKDRFIIIDEKLVLFFLIYSQKIKLFILVQLMNSLKVRLFEQTYYMYFYS